MDYTEKTNSRYWKGFALAIIGAMLFSMRPILVKFAYQDPIDSVSLLALRMIFSAPFYLVFLLYLLKRFSAQNDARYQALDTQTIIYTCVIGLMGYYAASLLDLYGLLYISAQLERLVLFTYPTLVVIFGALFFKQTISKHIVFALIFSYLGIISIFLHDLNTLGSDVIKGSLFVGASMVIFALYVLFGKRIIDRTGSRLFTCIAMLAASIGILSHFFITNQPTDLITTQKVYWISFFIAIFCTIIPSFCISEAIACIGPDRTSIMGTVGPVFTSLFAVSLLGEPFTGYHLLGMTLVIIGVLILGKSKPKSP